METPISITYINFIWWFQAEIFCKQLGFFGADYNSYNSGGKVSQKFSIEAELKCEGSEQSIQECRQNFNIKKCNYRIAAGVICKSNKKT